MSEKKSSGCGNIIGSVIVFFIVVGIINTCSSAMDEAATTPYQSPTYQDITTPAQTPPPRISAALEPQPPPPAPVFTPPPVDEIRFASVIKQVPSSNETITRHFAWQDGLYEWTWDMTIPQALYDYYKALPRSDTPNYAVYVTHPLDDPYISALVERLKDAATQSGYDEYQTIELAKSFVQSLPYTVDSVTTGYDEYPRYPAETLVDGGGDCEDTSILLAAIVDNMGYGVVLLGLPNHMAVGVKGGDNVRGSYWTYETANYFYIETTGTGWDIGDIPDEYSKSSAHIFTMVPVPIISHEWRTEHEGPYTRIKVKVKNLGSATASSVYVSVAYDAGNDRSWNPVYSELMSVEADTEATVTLTLRDPPQGIHTRLIVQIIEYGHSLNESHSDWFDT